MPLIRYIETHFAPATKTIIETANSIIEEYQEKGFDLTLRQLYYQFVARGLLPNKQREYNRLGNIINDARMAGWVDWDAIVDRTRNLEQNSHWQSPEEIIAACARQFMIDKWAKQPNRVEVWIEKDALKGVIAGVCRRLDVPYFSCRGYTSSSEMWRAAYYRLAKHIEEGQTPFILHLGDHDPSGVDMTRDITERLALFSGHPVEVKRLALTINQVEELNPPPNPAKLSDSRATQYIRLHGDQSWELDALEPTYLERLIEQHILRLRDDGYWQDALEEEQEMKERLQSLATRGIPEGGKG